MIIPSLVVGVLSYFLARRKNISEATKNEADAEKSLADAEKSHVETVNLYIGMVGTLNKEIANWIGQVKGLRDEVEEVVKEKDNLEKEVRQLKRDSDTNSDNLKYELRLKLLSVIEPLDRLTKAMTELVDILISRSAPQSQRMQAVAVLEGLHNLRKELKK